MRALGLISAVSLIFGSCAPESAGGGEGLVDDSTAPIQARDAVIWGTADDRRDPFNASGVHERIAISSEVALVCLERLSISGSSVTPLDTLQSRLGVCATEPFSGQSSASFCSGTLIDEDVVLTAGHCASMTCTGGMRVLTNYRMNSSSTLNPLSTADLYTVSMNLVGPTVGTVDVGGGTFRTFDHWVFRLDRKVSRPNGPAAVRKATTLVSSSHTLISHPAGLPVKVDASGVVQNAGWIQGLTTTFPCVNSNCDQYSLTVDSYKGSSGGGIFQRTGGSREELAGILVQGGWTGPFYDLGSDFTSPPGCAMSLLCSSGTCLTPIAQYASQPLAQLCSVAPTARSCSSLGEIHAYEFDAIISVLSSLTAG